MDPAKKKLVLERLGGKIVPLNQPPFNVPWEFPNVFVIKDVPYYPQEQMTWSGAAVLQMILEYHGCKIPQEIIAAIAAPDPYPAYGTETWRENARRVASVLGFSAMSYYPLRFFSLEQIAVNEPEVHAINTKVLKSIVSQGKPALVRLREVRTGVSVPLGMESWLSMVGHVCAVVGYNEQEVIFHDPWNKSEWGGQGGEFNTMPWDHFHEIWVNSCLGYILLVQPACQIHIDTIPAILAAGQPFDLPIRFAYEAPKPFDIWAPIIHQPIAILELECSGRISFRQSQHPVKLLAEEMHPGQTVAVRWALGGTESSAQVRLKVKFEGIVKEPNAPFPYVSKLFTEKSESFKID